MGRIVETFTLVAPIYLKSQQIYKESSYTYIISISLDKVFMIGGHNRTLGERQKKWRQSCNQPLIAKFCISTIKETNYKVRKTLASIVERKWEVMVAHGT